MVNVLLYFSYDKVFYRLGISKKIFMNSTLLGTTTGFTFPFLAVYYNFRNVAILYSIVIVTVIFMLNSKYTALVPAGMNYLVSKPSLLCEHMLLPAPIEDMMAIQYTSVQALPEPMEEALEVMEGQDEYLGFLGECFDSPYLYMDEISEEEDQVIPHREEPISSEVLDPYRQALRYREEGNYVKALEGFMASLKGAVTFDEEFSSCISIASIYKEMGQPKQAENVLYCFVQQHRDSLQNHRMEEVANILRS